MQRSKTLGLGRVSQHRYEVDVATTRVERAVADRAVQRKGHDAVRNHRFEKLGVAPQQRLQLARNARIHAPGYPSACSATKSPTTRLKRSGSSKYDECPTPVKS